MIGGEVKSDMCVYVYTTHLMLSVCVLYSMIVFGGRFRTRRRVSLMRAVVDWSLAVLFQIDMISS